MEIILETKIQNVTVYPDRARVTCQGVCDISPGTHYLVMEELPLSVVPDSVRVVGSGTAQVRLLGVEVRRRHYEETPSSNIRLLEQDIEQLEDDLHVLEDEKGGWLAQSKYLDGLRQATVEFAKGLSRGRTSIEDQVNLTQFLREQDSDVRSAIRELDIQQREKKHRLDKLRRDLREISSARPRQRFQARIEVEALTEGNFQPELIYLVNNAGWQPLYDVRLVEEGDSSIVDVSYIAQVTQKTGQDWKNVDLVVSTARPALNQRLPELKPWFVDAYVPPRPRKPRKMAARAAMPTVMQAAAVEPDRGGKVPEAPSMEAEVVVATIQETGTAVSFTVSGKIDIPSDGSLHKTTLNQFSLVPKLDYLAVPKHTNAVYRRAKVINNTPGPIMAGQANLFVGDEFIGRTQFKYTPPNAEIELLLGVEERITVEREMVKRDVDKRLLRDNRQLRYGYEIKLENLRKVYILIEVCDHIPVSRHEKIKVQLTQVKPDPSEKSEMNMLEWVLRLDANEEQTIRYEYMVEHPREQRIVGLID